ncbi:hypothetical protein [Frigoribacterium sp. UYMn621]|uniref:hypothetical protein n=1 Tax=Frigoribacterium sp. UYMn621 TaxID=3156343 RepID=UPI00339649CF
MSVTDEVFWIELATGELWIAHETADLVAGFIPGYLDLDPSEREAARRAFATTVSAVVQHELFANAITAGAVDLATISDSAVDRMLGYGEPYDGSPWLEIVPLVVLGGSDDGWRPPPGNVIVFDARRDGAFILSLAAIGKIRTLGLLSGPALLPHPLGL